MSLKRGDVILAFVLNVGSAGGKLRPALVVQSDHNNIRLDETIIAAITSALSQLETRVAEVARLPISQRFIGSLATSATNEPVFLALTKH